MEVVATAPNGGGASPFHNHDVREWSRIDSLTGVLERARRETDHWAANTNNSSHKYGKVVDCRARSGVDGNLQQEARRQLEVFQSQIPGSRLQVIKTHSVSSSRWTKKAGQEAHQELSIQGLEDLQFPVNPLDVSIQKSKASLGRSIARRALSKQTNVRNESTTTQTNDDISVTSLRRVSRLCHQIHDDAVKQYFQRTPVRERRSANGNGVEINETQTETKTHEHSNSTRTGSTSSSEDSNSAAQHPNTSNEQEKSTKIAKDLEDLEKLRTWRRTLKLRRSLQLPKETKAPTKPADLPENSGSVRRIREDIEKGRRLNTALRGNNVDFEALDQILQSISGPSHMDPDRESVTSEDKEDTDDSSRKQKRNSFVTVESIKQVRNRLRRTSSPSAYLYKDKEESDDGIVTEDSKTTSKEPNGAAGASNRVRSYVYGMENTMSKLNLNGTGSLESRSKHLNSNFGNKNEDWYNRRKSYGFEKMHNQGEDAISKVKTTESSTDSGICHSSEIVMNTIQEIKVKSNDYDDNNWENIRNNKNFNGTTITIPITNSPAVNDKGFFRLDQADEKENMKRHSIAVDESQYVIRNAEPKFRRTSLTNDSYEDDFSQSRKQKKVGFCKTEVHFTAESGRVNIVETDGKPPPTNNFRRRRRNTGLILDEFRNSNGLPVFKFGDDLFNDDTTEDNEICRGLVTVSSNTINRPYHDNEEEAKENGDSDIPKGILKNKPIKPKPYLLGIDTVLNDSQNFHEDIKLKSTRDQPTIWRSTVTVRNTSYAQNTNGETFQEEEEQEEEEVPEFRKLLRNLKPVSKLYDSSSPNGIRIVSPNVDARNSHQWPVTNAGERRRQNDDFKLAESKGYSTKINFGSGQATVIENTNARQNGRHPTWPRREDTSNDVKGHILNKGLVVRIGRDDSGTKHTVCSKTTTNNNNPGGTTTTTKITIDLTPSPTTTNGRLATKVESQPFKLPITTSLSNFKSTSLILNTIKADSSILSYTEKGKTDLDAGPKIPDQLEALKKLYEEEQSDSETDREVQTFMSKSLCSNGDFDEECSSVVSGSWSKVSALKNVSRYYKLVTKSGTRSDLHAQLEKDLDSMQNIANTNPKRPQRQQSKIENRNNSENVHRKDSKERSPLVMRKAFSSKTASDDSGFDAKKLSSPALVGQSTLNKRCDTKIEVGKPSPERSITKKGSLERQKPPQRFRNKSPSKEVLRQPKKSEMGYFGVPVSPKTRKNEIVISESLEKPDLLQFTATKKESSKPKEPIYENVDSLRKKKSTTSSKVKREFSSDILEELTKAADEILQAVNEHTADDIQNKFNTDDEAKPKGKSLDTISETTSWKQTKTNRTHTSASKSNSGGKIKVKHTPSNSSADSVSRERKSTSARVDQRNRHKTQTANGDNTAAKANAKARRLQRASSREALLQSRGSSSEDLPAVVEVPSRKHRLMKKIKSTQSTEQNSTTGKTKSSSASRKKEGSSENKFESRVVTSNLPEIRHKTAVSTIRSTAEKSATRDKSEKIKHGETKKRTSHHKQDTSGTVGAHKSDKSRETVKQRTPTSNGKKCRRYEASFK